MQAGSDSSECYILQRLDLNLVNPLWFLELCSVNSEYKQMKYMGLKSWLVYIGLWYRSSIWDSFKIGLKSPCTTYFGSKLCGKSDCGRVIKSKLSLRKFSQVLCHTNYTFCFLISIISALSFGFINLSFIELQRLKFVFIAPYFIIYPNSKNMCYIIVIETLRFHLKSMSR